jgi:hypothetical protein
MKMTSQFKRAMDSSCLAIKYTDRGNLVLSITCLELVMYWPYFLLI